jgi:hypothetical protein
MATGVPMTYMVDGRQIIVVAEGSQSRFASRLSMPAISA